VVYMWRKARGKEAEFEARRRTHFERAMGKSRTLPDIKKELPADPHREEELNDSDGEDSPRTELLLKSEKSRLVTEKPVKSSKKDIQGLSAIPRASRAQPLEEFDFDGEERKQRSWWSRVYGRLSTNDVDEEAAISSHSKERKPKDAHALLSPSSKDNVRAYARQPVDLDEPPPPSLLGRRQRDHRSGDKADPIQKKLSASVWDPSMTQPPRLPSEPGSPESPPRDIKAVESLADPSAQNEVEVRSAKHEREDSFFGRIFNRSPDHSKLEDEHEHHIIQLPSLFQRKQDIMKTVKGWDPAKSPDAPVPEKPVIPITSPDLPSIPSMSPSPPRPIKDKAPVQPIVQPITPAQPTPVLHKSLSEARRPSLLIADEAGILIQPEIPKTKPRGRVQEWVESTKAHEGTWNSKTVSGSSQSRMNARPSNTLDTSVDIRTGPITTLPPQKLKESYPARGPRRPKQIVMPTPLSPARYPGGTSDVYHGMNDMGRSIAPQRGPLSSGLMSPQHQLPPGAGFGRPNMPGMGNSAWPQQPYSQVPFVPSMPVNGPPHWNATAPSFNPYASYAPPLPPLHASPGEILIPRPQGQVSSPDGSGSDTRQPRRRDRKRSSRKRSQSPFGIEAASSDAESLPRHPVLRQHTARQRRRSQPLPDVPASERPNKPLPDSSQPSNQADKPTNPSASVTNLPNTSAPNSPSSLNGDSRYPRGTSRSNYFDSYDTVSPYLTNIMNDGLPPQNAPRTLSAPNSDSSPGRTQLRR
jgi:hypothetical protein